MRARIRYIGQEGYTELENDMSFEDFIYELFRKPIYLSLSRRCGSIAINTSNIVYIEDITLK